LWVPGGISAMVATTYLCMARRHSHMLRPSSLGEQRRNGLLLLRAGASYAMRGQADNLLLEAATQGLSGGMLCRQLYARV
jgi:hypothetical protein